jgi:hypothetical protein
LYWALTSPERIVIGAKNATVVRYQNERVGLAAHHAARIGRQ